MDRQREENLKRIANEIGKDPSRLEKLSYEELQEIKTLLSGYKEELIKKRGGK